MFGTCGSPCSKKLGDLQVVEKITYIQKLAYQMAPPECDDFFDHLQITSILAHMISCTNKASFPMFYIYLNFLLIYNAL